MVDQDIPVNRAKAAMIEQYKDDPDFVGAGICYKRGQLAVKVLFKKLDDELFQEEVPTEFYDYVPVYFAAVGEIRPLTVE